MSFLAELAAATAEFRQQNKSLIDECNRTGNASVCHRPLQAAFKKKLLIFTKGKMNPTTADQLVEFEFPHCG